MQFLIREITQDQGQVVNLDNEIEADVITIGSAADQLIQLRGGSMARQHAQLKFKGGKLTITCAGKKNRVKVFGESVSQLELTEGDEVEFESHKLIVVAAPAGFDAACELYVDQDLQGRAFESAYVTDLADTVLGKRGPAYWMTLAVVLLAFAWPFSAFMMRSADGTSSDVDSTASQGDVLWLSGPLHAVHKIEIGDDCSACHKVAFEPVQDAACLDCHQGTPVHYSEGVKGHLALQGTACQNCHKEHNEPESLIVDDDALCVDCHFESMVPAPQATATIAATGFNPSTHPEFKLNFLLPTASQRGTGLVLDWRNERMEYGSNQKEVSNLKFPHDEHLDIDKVQINNDGRGMTCADCHSLKTDNQHFEEITMEQHCQSCHDLTFDLELPDRQLPHGRPSAVVQTIEEHFVKVYTDPKFKESSTGTKRRRPGRSQKSNSCSGPSFQCGMERAVTEANIQFTQRGCVTCHEVSDNDSEDIYARWQVLPVRITPDWYSSGLFDHKSHLTTRGKTEIEVCSSCHKAKESHVSNDVMIPGMENCLECHGDKAASDKVIVNCVSCHAYHLDGYVDPFDVSLQKAGAH